ncbi:MAG: hypothetical protein LBG07_04865, partial [Treponema sp.]|nr:hypothetical protein [Treponema sp.]
HIVQFTAFGCMCWPAWMLAVINCYVFAKQKRKAQKWHGCHFLAAQGIEAEIPETLPQVKSRNWSG